MILVFEFHRLQLDAWRHTAVPVNHICHFAYIGEAINPLHLVRCGYAVFQCVLNFQEYCQIIFPSTVIYIWKIKSRNTQIGYLIVHLRWLYIQFYNYNVILYVKTTVDRKARFMRTWNKHYSATRTYKIVSNSLNFILHFRLLCDQYPFSNVIQYLYKWIAVSSRIVLEPNPITGGIRWWEMFELDLDALTYLIARLKCNFNLFSGISCEML